MFYCSVITIITYSDPSSTSPADTFCPEAVLRPEVMASPTTVGIQRLRTDKREEKSVWFYSNQNVQIFFSVIVAPCHLSLFVISYLCSRIQICESPWEKQIGLNYQFEN